jgi:hypothetical protein
MRQAEDLLFQGTLERARSASLTEEDVATLNSQTVAARIARGEDPLDRAVIRINQLREDVNLAQHETFAIKQAKKVYLFPSRHDAPNVAIIDQALLIRMMFRVGEAGKRKGPGFLAFTKGTDLATGMGIPADIGLLLAGYPSSKILLGKYPPIDISRVSDITPRLWLVWLKRLFWNI